MQIEEKMSEISSMNSQIEQLIHISDSEFDFDSDSDPHILYQYIKYVIAIEIKNRDDLFNSTYELAEEYIEDYDYPKCYHSGKICPSVIIGNVCKCGEYSTCDMDDLEMSMLDFKCDHRTVPVITARRLMSKYRQLTKVHNRIHIESRRYAGRGGSYENGWKVLLVTCEDMCKNLLEYTGGIAMSGEDTHEYVDSARSHYGIKCPMDIMTGRCVCD